MAGYHAVQLVSSVMSLYDLLLLIEVDSSGSGGGAVMKAKKRPTKACGLVHSWCVFMDAVPHISPGPATLQQRAAGKIGFEAKWVGHLGERGRKMGHNW